MKKLSIFWILILLLTAGVSLAAPANPLAPLRMSGLNFTRQDGSRFVISGLNIESYRDYAGGCGWASDGLWDVRVAMAARIASINVNIVRLNYSYRFLNTTQNFNRFMDIAEAFANNHIYIMPSDHTYTGGTLGSSSASYPMMKKIIDNARARGIGNYLVMNPWNEPGPDVSVAQWTQAQKDVLTYLRNTATFTGIVVMDGTGWSTMLNETAFKEVIQFDAGLRGGVANVAFSHHLYPNITSLPGQLWTASKNVPLLIGELGQENPGASPNQPSYVTGVINGFFNTGRANGHNGLFAWIWNWCDTNKMLNDWGDPSVPYTNASTLSSHGQLWVTNYYSKMPPLTGGGTLEATATSLPPTATRTATPRPPTSTPRPPTNTPTPVGPTNTPVPGEPTVTPSPTTCAEGQVPIEIRIGDQTLVLCAFRP